MRDVHDLRLPLASGGALLLCLLFAFAGPAVTNHLAYDRVAILDGEIWRLWTGHLVHFSLQHLLVDAGALLLIGAVAEREMGGRWVAIALLAGAPLISVGLLLSAPDMSYFRGASALPILLGVAVGVSFWNSKPHLRMFLILCGAFLLIKVLFEATGFPLNAAALPTEIHVAWQAHLLAIISGCCTYCLRGKY